MWTAYTVFLPWLGAPISGSINWPEEPSLAQIKRVVAPFLGDDAAFPKRVNVFHEGSYTDMIVDGDANQKGLPLNGPATDVYRNNALTHEPGTKAEDLPVIRGPAVLFGRKVWF